MLPDDWDIAENPPASLRTKPKTWQILPDVACTSFYALVGAACVAAFAWVPDLAHQIECEHRAEVNRRLRQQVDSWLIANEGRSASEAEHGVPPIPGRRRAPGINRST